MLGKPILDNNAPWKQRFRAPEIIWSQLAKSNPDHGVVATNQSGAYQLYAWDVPTGALRQLTHQPEGKLFGYLSPDGRYVYYQSDAKGNEIGHIVRVRFDGGEPQDITPGLPPYARGDIAVSDAGNLLALDIVTSEGFHLYVIDLDEAGDFGTPRLLRQAKPYSGGPIIDHGGEVVIWHSTERSGKFQFNLLALESRGGRQIGELWDGPDTSVQAVTFSPLAHDMRILATSDRSGVKRPLIWNPLTGERIDLELDKFEGEVVPLDWSLDGQELLLSHFVQARQQLYLYRLSDQSLVQLKHPSGSFGVAGGVLGQPAYFGPGDEIFAQWQDANHPPHLIALNHHTGIQTRTVLAVSDAPSGHAWQSITFTSSDSQIIQGWLALPKDRSEGPFPTILHTHGGPSSVMTETFMPECQVWLDHGFAFLTINYRGSIAFGREFQNKITDDIGHWEVEDMVAARDWLVKEGIAHPDKILVTGWSYGGYLTLLALGKRPDLWAGGMAGVAIADWVLLYEDEAESLRGFDRAIFGGTPEEKPEQYASASPITYTEAVRAPVLIIQGRNDTRCPARQVEAYEARLKALGKAIEVHWFDAGHLGAGTELDIQHHEIMLKFAYKVLS